MLKNYFFLNRFIIEAAPKLQNTVLTNIFSQEKDKLVLEFSGGSAPLYLEISVNPGLPYITLKNRFSRAKRNTVDIFPGFSHSPFSALLIHNSDRIIAISTAESTLFFTIRGKYTNVYYVNENGIISSFKKEDEQTENSFLSEVKNALFVNEFNIPPLSIPPQVDFYSFVRQSYPFISKELLHEVKARAADEEPGYLLNILINLLNEIKSASASVFINNYSGEVNIAVNTFSLFPDAEVKTFGSYIEALNFYLSKKYYVSELTDKRKLIARHLDKELTKIASKINNIKGRIERGSREEEYNRTASLILINIGRIRQGMESIDIEDIYNQSGLITVKLDPALDARRNADAYYNKSRAERLSFEKSRELYNDLTSKFERLKSIQVKFSQAEESDDYDNIMKELRIKQPDASASVSKDDIKSKFKQYIIEGNWSVFVGKDSKNNDLLTVKFAKQNDYWFHARAVPGSHVVLRVDNPKQPVPKSIIKAAAALAAYHSKAKTSSLAPVSYAFKKYVVKKKGMDPGKVALLKEDVILVRPEIPSSAEYVSEE